MLAGILLPICLAPVFAAVGEDTWWQGVTVVIVWLVFARLAPRWAVPAAVVATAIVVAVATGGNPLEGQSIAPTLRFILPSIDPIVLISLGVPLYVVTMAGQNVPGFTVLRTFGYENVPARAILAASGAGTIVGGLFGAYTLNLSAITAAMMAGPDSHPDRSKRWITTVTSGSSYIVLGLGASAATALVSASPPILITAIAGLALFGALASSVTSALDQPEHRIVAIITCLLVGAAVMLWFGWRRRRKPDAAALEDPEP
jgi:benzoate membrane transport protein